MSDSDSPVYALLTRERGPYTKIPKRSNISSPLARRIKSARARIRKKSRIAKRSVAGKISRKSRKSRKSRRRH